MTPKTQLYRDLAAQLRELLADERDLIANAANLAALLYHGLPELNWAGCYFLKGGVLVLGPFQGKPACTRIALGKGVCGTAAATGRAVLVENVHEFPGHIACDGASNWESCCPWSRTAGSSGCSISTARGLGRFDDEDQAGLELLVQGFIELTEIAAP